MDIYILSKVLLISERLLLLSSKNNMFYKILLCFFIFFVFSSQSFAQEENYILQYARCNELLQSPFIADHIAL